VFNKAIITYLLVVKIVVDCCTDADIMPFYQQQEQVEVITLA